MGIRIQARSIWKISTVTADEFLTKKEARPTAMKNIKKRILIIVFAAIAAIAVMFFIAFNLFINRYFETEAAKAIQNDIDWTQDVVNTYSSNIFKSYLKYYYFDIDNPVDDEYDQTSAVGAHLRKYLQARNLPMNTVLTLSENDHKYYYACVYYKYEVPTYDGEVTTGNDVESNSSEEYVTTYMIFVDVLPVMSFSNTLNIIFLIILVVVTAVMCFLGIRLGSSIEYVQSSQNKFFQNASHELKTPLMSIQGYAEAIQTDIMDHHRAADIIMEESDRMTSLVEEILAISKIDTGNLKLNLMQIDVKEILYDCLRSENILLQKQGIDVDLDFCSRKVLVMGDDVQLRRAFMNIISNDIRYCKSKLSISCQIERGKAVIVFADDGDGFDPETLDKIFARFYIGQKGQTGIGLALTKEIITLHKGKIKAYNGSAGGSVFEIVLPGCSR